VRVSCDDRRVLSSGGTDCAVMVYETHGMVHNWEWRYNRKVNLPLKVGHIIK
jgi:hypothetical protein